MVADSMAYITNPLNAFLLIKRLSYDLNQTKRRAFEIVQHFTMKTERFALSRADFEGAVVGLERLQEVYGLQEKDLAKGVIDGKKYRDDLTANELFAIGEELLNTEHNKTSLSYLNLALEKNREFPEMSSLTILERITSNHNKTGNLKGRLETIEKMIKLAPERTDLEEIRVKLEMKLLFAEEKDKPVAKQPVGYTKAREFKIVSKVCSGELTQTDEEISKLHCRYVSKTAFSSIAPFKVQEASLNPYIAIYYDIMSEDDMQAFKSLSKPFISRASVLGKNATRIVRETFKNISMFIHLFH